MIEVPSPADNTSNVLAVQAYGLHLEPPTRDVVSFTCSYFVKNLKYRPFRLNNKLAEIFRF